MTNKKRKIGVVAPGSRMSSEVAASVQALAATLYPDRTPEIHFHPQCFAAHGHFAGDDATRAQAFLAIARESYFKMREAWERRKELAQILAGLERQFLGGTHQGFADPAPTGATMDEHLGDLTTALTLNKTGQTHIETSRQAAEALRPLAGNFAALLFTLGVIVTGFLAIPPLAGSAAFGLPDETRYRAMTVSPAVFV